MKKRPAGLSLRQGAAAFSMVRFTAKNTRHYTEYIILLQGPRNK
jgi:hypothetical protein